ncbi:hypothetical protein ACLOJK_031620 [Asimina triloba]
MARRNPLPSYPSAAARDLPYGRAPHHPRLLEDPRLHHLPARPHPYSLLEPPHHDIQTLLVDNQRLAATHVALKQELAAVQRELRSLSAAAADIKAERDAQGREVYQRSVELEDELHTRDVMASELAQVRADVKKLGASNKQLAAQLQNLNGELALARAELQQVPVVNAEIEGMQKELKRGRAAVDYEKKAHVDNLQQSQAMENMISMAREVEKLRAELANNAEKRVQAAAAVNPELPDTQVVIDTVQAIADGGSQYGVGTDTHRWL